MPSDGLACLVEDLNQRNEPVAEAAREYVDTEGVHLIVALDSAGIETFRAIVRFDFLGAARNRPSAGNYCEPKRAGEDVLVRATYSTVTDGWSVALF